MTVEAYLAMERESDERHDYLDGEIFAMTGASLRHNLITSHLLANLHAQLLGGDCSVVANDMRVRVPSMELFTYPDIVVFCGPPELDDDHHDTLSNPVVLIEVLSASTEAYDRTTRFDHYRTLTSLRDYVLVAQDRPHVERYSRQSTHLWEFWESAGIDDSLSLPSLQMALPLAEIYRDLPEAP